MQTYLQLHMLLDCLRCMWTLGETVCEVRYLDRRELSTVLN